MKVIQQQNTRVLTHEGHNYSNRTPGSVLTMVWCSVVAWLSVVDNYALHMNSYESITHETMAIIKAEEPVPQLYRIIQEAVSFGSVYASFADRCIIWTNSMLYL